MNCGEQFSSMFRQREINASYESLAIRASFVFALSSILIRDRRRWTLLAVRGNAPPVSTSDHRKRR
jgi:hypothetical protein